LKEPGNPSIKSAQELKLDRRDRLNPVETQVFPDKELNTMPEWFDPQIHMMDRFAEVVVA